MSDSPTLPLSRRVSAVIFGAGVLAYGGFWMHRMAGWPGGLPVLLAAATLAGVLWWYALRGKRAESRRAMVFGCAGGILVGLAGCAAGFLGPMILAPTANQGPLLGLFYTDRPEPWLEPSAPCSFTRSGRAEPDACTMTFNYEIGLEPALAPPISGTASADPVSLLR
jgi:hypothetical protein